MRTLFQLIALVLLALTSAAIVFMVNAPKWMDGQPVAMTRPA